ncbi:hypothetical protein XENOCAPTIV_019972 [Xenoophorus captivus]|uniref:Noggin n=1 Tax=Xenoophorus captivus TaxID=1517983 RepID=A0ABV0R1D8_9TELE
MDPSSLFLLFLSLALCIQDGLCQHLNHFIRPIPSDSLPVDVPKEEPDPMLDPKEKDLNGTELRSLLGSHFNPDFMSVSPPEDLYEDDPDQIPKFSGQHLHGSEHLQLQTLELEVLFGKKQKANRKLRRMLWAYTLCPVVYAWTELGWRFWPRYLKVGSCYSKRSCSVPEGMVCKPAKATHLTFLRWHCLQKKVPLRCSWIHIQYPVISECKCTCPT